MRLSTPAAPGTLAASVRSWLDERLAEGSYEVRRIPFSALEGWGFEPGTGDLRHADGRFFTVTGLRVTADGRSWEQPIIDQPEVGVLGLLVKDFGGEPHCLLQAKMEPGNAGTLQLSPTVQATRSNYTRAHRGRHVRYLEYFTGASPRDVLVDVAHSEHGTWFLGKHNRNMVVRVTGDVPAHPDFRWIPLRALGELLRVDDLVNMDTRSVLSCLSPARHGEDGVAEIRGWLAGERARRSLHAERTPLADVRGWHWKPAEVRRADGRYFRVIAVDVRAGAREVTRWTQPLLATPGLGVIAFLAHRAGGVLRLLAHARVEAGFANTVQLGPTVQFRSGDRPPFADLVLNAPAERILYDGVQSEEGGRLYQSRSRYLIVETDHFDPPPGYRWLTPAQLGALVRRPGDVTVQARSLLALVDLLGLS